MIGAPVSVGVTWQSAFGELHANYHELILSDYAKYSIIAISQTLQVEEIERDLKRQEKKLVKDGHEAMIPRIVRSPQNEYATDCCVGMF